MSVTVQTTHPQVRVQSVQGRIDTLFKKSYQRRSLVLWNSPSPYPYSLYLYSCTDREGTAGRGRQKLIVSVRRTAYGVRRTDNIKQYMSFYLYRLLKRVTSVILTIETLFTYLIKSFLYIFSVQLLSVLRTLRTLLYSIRTDRETAKEGQIAKAKETVVLNSKRPAVFVILILSLEGEATFQTLCTDYNLRY